MGNMEAASYVVMHASAKVKTVDLLDFFVVHLSWYERLLNRDGPALRPRVLARLAKQKPRPAAGAGATDRVVVVMPFYASSGHSTRDSGHSAFDSRKAYSL